LILQAQRGSIQQDELSPQEKQALQGEEQQQKITTYEEAFKRIKEATGVSDTMVRNKTQHITFYHSYM
jgi:hypothetical protein